MLSSVFISGRLGEIKDNQTRIIEVDHVIPGESGHYAVTKIPVRAPYQESLLMKAKPGCLAIIKGRLEAVNEKDGIIYVVDEIDEIYQFPNGMKKN